MALFKKKNPGTWQTYYKANSGLEGRYDVIALYRDGAEFTRVSVAYNLDEKDADELLTTLCEIYDQSTGSPDSGSPVKR